jgi:hypothetical protein
MSAAKGYNIVSSKSTRTLPINKNGDVSKHNPGKFISEQQINLNSERMRVSESVKSILHREKIRDEQLTTRLKKINEK